jgi:hypothetical protein
LDPEGDQEAVMRGLDAFTAPLGAVVAAVSWRIHLSPRFSQISGALVPARTSHT